MMSILAKFEDPSGFHPMPVYDFSTVNASLAGMTDNKAPDDSFWVWHKEGNDENNPDKIVFSSVSNDYGYWDAGSYGQIEILPEDLVGSASLNAVMDVINDMSSYGDFIPNNHDRGATNYQLFVGAYGQTDFDNLATQMGPNTTDSGPMGNYNWDDYLTTYDENGGFFVNDSYGNPTEVGDFAAFANYQMTGLYGDFNTSTDPGAYGMNFLVESYGGVFVEPSEASDETVGGTDKTDVYVIDDYHAAASGGSDVFILGLGASEGLSGGFYQNATYDGSGDIDLVASDPRADMDLMFMSWLPEGVVVDANFGSVTHGSGGVGSNVYTDYFNGIEAFDLTSHDDIFAGGGDVDINWVNPGAGDDTIFGVDKIFTVLDYSSNDEPEGLVVVNQNVSAGIDIDLLKGVDLWNGWLPENDIISGGTIAIENGTSLTA